MNPDPRTRFLNDVAFGTALNGTVQRGNVYRHGTDAPSRKRFRSSLRESLDRLVKEQYQRCVSDEKHFENIATLASDLSNKHRDVLANGRFRIGSAQKALNLLLKLEWCFGFIPSPPHCPFDSIVLKRIPKYCDLKWTQLDSIATYRDLVEHAKREANGQGLAEWELREYTEDRSG